jgi:hypothetical protein
LTADATLARQPGIAKSRGRWDDDGMPGEQQEPPGAASARELAARLQELVDTKPSEGGHPLEWAVPAYFLGDMSALAALSLRAGR